MPYTLNRAPKLALLMLFRVRATDEPDEPVDEP